MNRAHTEPAVAAGPARGSVWWKLFADENAMRPASRLLHHSQVITIRGDSYRLREKRRAGLIKATLSDAAAA